MSRLLAYRRRTISLNYIGTGGNHCPQRGREWPHKNTNNTSYHLEIRKNYNISVDFFLKLNALYLHMFLESDKLTIYTRFILYTNIIYLYFEKY